MQSAGIIICRATIWQGEETGLATSYCSPLIIAAAAMIFMFFKQVNMGTSKIINGMAKGAFTVFLLHGYFLGHIGIERFAQGNVFLLLVHVAISVVVICLICWCVYFIYDKIAGKIFGVIKQNVKMPEIWVEAER